MAWLSALILLCSQGYIGFHTARTGDSDSLLSLFMLVNSIYFLKFLERGDKKQVLFFMLFLTLAFATKLWAAFLFLPAYFFILIRRKALRQFFLNWQFLAGLVLFLVSVFSLFYLRELNTPGYIKEVFFKDAGRVLIVVEDHKQSWHYYLDNFASERFAIWFMVFLAAIVLLLFNKENSDGLMINLLLISCSYLVIISASITKLYWYDMPLYPYFSILSAYGLFHFLNPVLNFTKNGSLTWLAIALLFIYPLWMMFRNAQANTISNGPKAEEANERYLFEKSIEREDISGLKVYYNHWSGSLLFYKYKFAEQGQKITLHTQPDFEIGDRVLVCNDSLKAVLNSKFDSEVSDFHLPSQVLVIRGKKPIEK